MELAKLFIAMVTQRSPTQGRTNDLAVGLVHIQVCVPTYNVVNVSPFTGFCYKVVPLPPDDFAESGATDAIGAGSVQQAVAPDKSLHCWLTKLQSN